MEAWLNWETLINLISDSKLQKTLEIPNNFCKMLFFFIFLSELSAFNGFYQKCTRIIGNFLSVIADIVNTNNFCILSGFYWVLSALNSIFQVISDKLRTLKCSTIVLPWLCLTLRSKKNVELWHEDTIESDFMKYATVVGNHWACFLQQTFQYIYANICCFPWFEDSFVKNNWRLLIF